MKFCPGNMKKKFPQLQSITSDVDVLQMVMEIAAFPKPFTLAYKFGGTDKKAIDGEINKLLRRVN